MQKKLSFSTELYLKQLLLLPPVAFYLAIFKHQSNHSTPAIKMQWTQYLLYTILRNYNSTSPQSLNKMDGQPLNKRCSRFGKKLSHFTSPHMCHITEPGYKISSEASGLLPSRPTYMGSGLKQRIDFIKHVMSKVNWKRKENASIPICSFQLRCPSRSSAQEEAVGFSSYLLLLNTNLICHVFP